MSPRTNHMVTDCTAHSGIVRSRPRGGCFTSAKTENSLLLDVPKPPDSTTQHPVDGASCEPRCPGSQLKRRAPQSRLGETDTSLCAPWRHGYAGRSVRDLPTARFRPMWCPRGTLWDSCLRDKDRPKAWEVHSSSVHRGDRSLGQTRRLLPRRYGRLAPHQLGILTCGGAKPAGHSQEWLCSPV